MSQLATGITKYSQLKPTVDGIDRFTDTFTRSKVTTAPHEQPRFFPKMEYLCGITIILICITGAVVFVHFWGWPGVLAGLVLFLVGFICFFCCLQYLSDERDRRLNDWMENETFDDRFDYILGNWLRKYCPNGYDTINDGMICDDMQNMIYDFTCKGIVSS